MKRFKCAASDCGWEGTEDETEKDCSDHDCPECADVCFEIDQPTMRTDAGDIVGVATSYEALHDGLSDMIESGRLTESAIPDDYQWLVESLVHMVAHPPAATINRDLLAAAQAVTGTHLFGNAPGGYIAVSRDAYDKLTAAIANARASAQPAEPVTTLGTLQRKGLTPC